jgi:predicted ArsR family transcriptional regulator
VTKQETTAADPTTRAQILRLVVTNGPISAVEIATTVKLAAAGIRRHLSELVNDGLIAEHDGPGGRQRRRGRPSRFFVATASAHAALEQENNLLAVEAIEFLATAAGPGAINDFAAQRAKRLEQRYVNAVSSTAGDLAARTRALAEAMNADGYAATVRPGPRGLTLQLCQGHCPVHQVARVFPEFCEAETRAIASILGVHVQRLATLAGGEHVCTTCVPVALEVWQEDGQPSTGRLSDNALAANSPPVGAVGPGSAVPGPEEER